MEFEIYQVKENYTRELGFVDLPEGTDEVDLSKYERVYKGQLNSQKVSNALAVLFAEFNLNHPADYCGRSMSVSDVVLLDGQYFYCCRVGWKKVQPKKTTF